ncbi:MAG: metallophosphoesterase [Synergistaceae bacterium]|nr:metallophosphoesterase [Synergistaceae bacterium]
MGTLHIPSNLPKPTLEEIRSCPIRSRIDNIAIKTGLNPPLIDGRDMILHLSDTPSTMFSYIRRAIRRLRPTWVVHTGDLVDDVKLEFRPGMLDLYQKKLRVLLELLSEETCGTILLTGNHDHLQTLLEMTENTSIQVWSKPGRFYIGSFSFKAGHTYEDVINDAAEYNLFGHSLEYSTKIDSSGRFFLNGLESMHLIHMETGDVIPFNYPPGTNDARLERKRVSL